jgi:superfamily II DNA or RNA helicase
VEWVAETPVKLRVPAELALSEELRKALAYKDLRAEHEYSRVKEMRWFAEKYGQAAFDEKLAEVDARRRGSLLSTDERGFYTYTGLLKRLRQQFGGDARRAYELPSAYPWAWASQPPPPRDFQEEAELLMIHHGHAAVELATGLGKSLIIAMLLRGLGLPAVVVTPTKSIAKQLYADLCNLLGKKRVGRFYDGHKEYQQPVTVAVSKSLVILQEDTPAWAALRAKPVLVGDESHLLPADTLAAVCCGLLGTAPWRFFLSGTQDREDGLDLLLHGLIGDIVLEMDARKGIAEGFLAPQRFLQWETKSEGKLHGYDAVKMNRCHLLQNERVHQEAATLVNAAVARGRRTMVMVDEFDQFPLLLKHLKAPYRVAHGGCTKDNRESLPEEHRKSDPEDLVRRFDAGEFPVLVGTSCIGIGTNIRSVSAICDLVGGSASSRLRQVVGRGTRLFPGKEDCVFMEPVISNVPVLAKQAVKRQKIFRTISDSVGYIGG